MNFLTLLSKRKCLSRHPCSRRRSQPSSSCQGGAAGGRSSPQMITCADLSKSTHDGLLRRVKRGLRKRVEAGGLTLSNLGWGVPAVFSTERPMYPDGQGGVCHDPPSNEALRLSCDAGFGSLSFVTGTFGFIAAGIAIDLIVLNASRDQQQSPHSSIFST